MSHSDITGIVLISLAWLPVAIMVCFLRRMKIQAARNVAEIAAMNRAWAMQVVVFCESMLALDGLDEGTKMGLRAARDVALEEALPSLGSMKEPML